MTWPALHAQNRPGVLQAWRGPALLVLNSDASASKDELRGFFFRETRYLSVMRLLVEGEEPVVCSAAEAASNELEYSLLYPDIEQRRGGGSGSGGDAQRHGLLTWSLDLSLRLRVRPASLEVTLVVCNRWNEVAEFEVGWQLAADFAGMLELLGKKREQSAAVSSESLPNGVCFRYAHPELPLETRVEASEGAEWHFSDGMLRTSLRLSRQESIALILRVQALDSSGAFTPAGEEAREAYLLSYADSLPVVHAPGENPLIALTASSLRDIGSASLLEGAEDEWLMPAAGYPLYAAAFGRDAATASWQAAAFDHGALARSTAACLARLQGTCIDNRRDEWPGRIIQQARRDPLSRLGQVPFDRYYGDVASPFMYIIALGNAYAWSGDRSLVEQHWDSTRRVLDWAREHGDLDGDGYIEYRTLSSYGPKHQGWKDSDNAVVDEEGRQVEPPFASCEIQGYYLAALQIMAAFSVVMGKRADALALWKESLQLKERFNRDFWLPEEGYVAFGLDAQKRPLPVLTSNAAQCIATGVVAREHLPRLVRRLFEPDLFSGWGLRTLTTRNPAYNPLSYHLGSVWPVENGSILFGLRRYGFDERALELARALSDLARLWPHGRIPECVGGYSREEHAHPGAFPGANPFQTWNQSVFPILLQTLLGAQAVGALHLLVVDPVLPSWLPEVTIRRWRIGPASVSLRFWRTEAGDSRYEVLEQEGPLHIIRQAPIESLTEGVKDRLGALFRQSLHF